MFAYVTAVMSTFREIGDVYKGLPFGQLCRTGIQIHLMWHCHVVSCLVAMVVHLQKCVLQIRLLLLLKEETLCHYSEYGVYISIYLYTYSSLEPISFAVFEKGKTMFCLPNRGHSVSKHLSIVLPSTASGSNNAEDRDRSRRQALAARHRVHAPKGHGCQLGLLGTGPPRLHPDPCQCLTDGM